MNIAVLYNGLARKKYKENFESFKRNVVGENPDHTFDFFLSFWDKSHPRVDNASPALEDIDTQNVVNTFNPQKYEILDYVKNVKYFTSTALEEVYKAIPQLASYGRQFVTNSIIMQSYGMQRTFNLLPPSGKGYDYIIKNRYDFIYPDPCKIIPVGEREILTLSRRSNQGFVDNVCAGRYEAMQVFMNSYDNLFNEEFMRTHGGALSFPEHLFRLSLVKEKIKICPKLAWGRAWKRR